MDGTAHIAPLRLFWWKAVPNFGDALAPLVVSHLSGRQVTHAGAGSCDLFAVGSILRVARRKNRAARADGRRPWIWGSGLLSPAPTDFLDHMQVALLRGPVTAALLGVRAARFGDPGLLAPEVLGSRPEPGERIGIVPHHSQADAAEIRALAASDPVFDLIDPRAPVDDVLRRIAACRVIVASSLHGLVVADAFGIPSLWADPGTQGRLKYHDYAAGIGRSLIAPLDWADLPAALRGLRDGPLPHAEGVAAARAALTETFPAQLCAADTEPRL